MIRLRILGCTELQDPHGNELRTVLAQPKRLALLVYLAASRGFHRRDTLLAMFWPELDATRAREALNQAVRFLRRELGGSRESLIVSRGAAELGVNSGSLWCDAAAFREHVETKRFGEALDLYRGDLLPGFHSEQSGGFEEWLEGERARLRGSAARAARELAESRERDQSFTTAVTSARRAVELAGLDERVVRDLLMLLDRLGDRAGAIHAYDEFVRRLASELEAEPAAETRAVIEQIRKRAVGRLVEAEFRLPESWPAQHVFAGSSPNVPPPAASAEQVAPIRLAPGLDLNGWRIIRELGRGGMATVYLALDVKHDRHVALKELRPELAMWVGTERFLREIQITAQLAHPHILPLIDSGSRDGLPYLVTPYVAGESLRARLNRESRLATDDALRLATEIAQALDYAHRCGIIHRDIKPENILLADGHAVVADFGIARAVVASGPRDSEETASGTVVGSPPYMSPEALRGAPIGVQTDIYALGCVLVEMLTGAPPAQGEALSLVRQGFEREVTELATDCIATDPARRPQTAAQLVQRLERITRRTTPVGALTAPATVSISRAKLPARRTTIAAGLAMITVLAVVVGGWRATHPLEPKRFTIEPPPGQTFIEPGPGFSIALSRDGKSLAFLTAVDGGVYLRRLDESSGVAFPKTRRAYDLHFSPDGKWLAYTNISGPSKIPTSPGAAGAEPTKLSRLDAWNGIAWEYSSDVVYVYADALWRVPASGGAPQKVASMDSTRDTHWWQPTMLSDGKTVAVRVTPRGAVGPGTDHLALISIADSTRTDLDLVSQGALGYVDGVLVFSRLPRQIMAVKLDLGRRKLLGEPVFVLDSVDMKTESGAMAAVSDNGTLAYLVRAPEALMQIVDDRGAVVASFPERRRFSQTIWSPDGRRIAMNIIGADEKSDIWIYDVQSHILTRLTQTGGAWPSWTADGKRVVFTGWGVEGLSVGKPMWVAADRSSPPEPIPGTSAVGSSIIQAAISPDGKFLVARLRDKPDSPAGTPKVVAVPLAGGPPVPLLAGVPNPVYLAISPDSKWIAYMSEESGAMEVYVHPFPGGGARTQVSTAGGSVPRWSGDGRSIFYRSTSGERGRTSWRTGVRVARLDMRGVSPRLVRTDSMFFDRALTDIPIESYDVHRDARLFAVTRDVSAPRKLVVITNWMTQVRAKLAGR